MPSLPTFELKWASTTFAQCPLPAWTFISEHIIARSYGCKISCTIPKGAFAHGSHKAHTKWHVSGKPPIGYLNFIPQPYVVVDLYLTINILHKRRDHWINTPISDSFIWLKITECSRKWITSLRTSGISLKHHQPLIYNPLCAADSERHICLADHHLSWCSHRCNNSIISNSSIHLLTCLRVLISFQFNQ